MANYLGSAILEYIGIYYIRQRRQPQLTYEFSVTHKTRHEAPFNPAWFSNSVG